MGDALATQRRQNRKIAVGLVVENRIEPLSGLDDVLHRAVLVARGVLDTVRRRANFDALAAPPDARDAAELGMKRANMRRHPCEREAQPHEPRPQRLEKLARIGRDAALLTQPPTQPAAPPSLPHP